MSAALVAPGAATAIVLVCAYIAPVALGVTIGRYHSTFILIWIAAMLGVVLASGLARGWRLPPRWRWPLIAVALVVAIGWPIVIWRETDFNLALLDNYRVANTSGGVAPPVAAIGILDTAITHLLGLLWFDCLYARYAGATSQRFIRFVAVPLGISAALSCALSWYQAFVDLTFWGSGALGADPASLGDDARRERVRHGRRVLAVRVRRAGGGLAGPAADDRRRCRSPAGVRGGLVVRIADCPARGDGRRGLRPGRRGTADHAGDPTPHRTGGRCGGRGAAIALLSVLPLPTIGPLERMRAGIARPPVPRDRPAS